MPPLIVYRIRSSIRGRPIQAFDDIVDVEDRTDLSEYDASMPDFQAKLYVSRSRLVPPSWSQFLQEGFPAAEIPKIRSANALLLINTTHRRKQVFFALPFGPAGRFMLRHGVVERGYGLRAALNVVYEGDDGSETYDVSRLRAVETKKVGENTFRSRQQANRSTALDAFAIDIRRDLLSRIDGPPRDIEVWGSRVGGGDSFNLNRLTTVAELGKICRSIQQAYDRNDYQVRFSSVDNTRVVEETAEIEAAIEQRLRSDDSGLDLVFPQLIDWDRIDGFWFDADRVGRVATRARRPDIRLAGYLASLGSERQQVTVDRLRKDSVRAIDADGQLIYRWSVWQCLAGEIEIDDEVFVLDEGSIYQVSKNYRDEIDAAVGDIPSWDQSPLQSSVPRATHEKDYNQSCASASDELLFMDRNLARSGRGVSPVEVCDLLHIDGSLIHVKRGWGSSLLSHLFDQGATSAELLIMDRNFCESAIGKVEIAETQQGASSGRFRQLISLDGGVTGAKHVVYAVIGEWRGRSLAQCLPFFAKVNLWQTADRLRRLGFRMSHVRVEAVAA